MGNKYTIYTFHISEGKKYFAGYGNLPTALLALWKLYRMKYFGCIYLEVR
jgi:hypothetical protein